MGAIVTGINAPSEMATNSRVGPTDETMDRQSGRPRTVSKLLLVART